MKNRNIKELLLYITVIFVMVMSLNLAVMESTGMSLSLLKILILSLASVLSSAVIIVFPIVLLIALLAGISGSVYLYFRNPVLIKLIAEQTVEFFNWLYGYIIGYNYFEPEYSLVFAILYIVLATFIISLIVFSGRGSFMLIVLGTAALTFFWFIYVEKARLYLMLFLFAAIMLYSYNIYKKKLKEWTQSECIIGANVSGNWIICSALIITVAILPGLILPLNISPVRWDWLNEKVIRIFPFVAGWRNDAADVFGYSYNSRYNLNLTGYKGKKLGGEMLQDPSVMMTVNTDSKETFYLRGAVKEKYTGYSWNKVNRKHKEYSSGYPMEIPYSDGVPTYERNLEISHKKLLTATVFAPFSVYEVWHKSNRVYVDDSSEVYSSKMITAGEAYTVKSLLPYIDIKKLRESGAKKLESREQELYLQLPGNISERVKALAQDITKSYDNNFDKAKAIEKYLRSSYKYTMKPSSLPDKKEFVDYFLFKGKEGYCTYYATSMVVLMRASGIPSRYVEGFVARYEDSNERNVRGTDAHAWAEAYFDGYGWITLEATPQYPVVEFRRPVRTERETASQVQENLTSGNINIPNLSRRRGRFEEDEGNGTGSVGYKSAGQSKGYLNTAMYAILVVLILRIVYMFLKRFIKEIKLEQYKGKKFADAYIRDILWHLRKTGFVLEPEETLREFMGRVSINYNERLTNTAYAIDLMEKIRYGKTDISIQERKNLEEFRKGVKRLAIKKSGFISFYSSLYIIGR